MGSAGQKASLMWLLRADVLDKTVPIGLRQYRRIGGRGGAKDAVEDPVSELGLKVLVEEESA